MPKRLLPFLLWVLVATACTGGDDAPVAEVVEIDWTPRIAATRALSPVDVDLLVLWEVNEEFRAGYLLSGLIDFSGDLADVTNASPITSNPRDRVIVNGDTAYLLTAFESVTARLPEGTEIIRAGVEDMEALGVVSMDPTILTGALGLLGAAGQARRIDVQTFEVDLDPTAALSALTDSELRAVPVSPADLQEGTGVAEVELAADGSTIERFRVRLSGSADGDESLLTIDYSVEPFPTPLTFDPPPAGSVVDLADVASVREAIGDLGPGF